MIQKTFREAEDLAVSRATAAAKAEVRRAYAYGYGAGYSDWLQGDGPGGRIKPLMSDEPGYAAGYTDGARGDPFDWRAE